MGVFFAKISGKSVVTGRETKARTMVYMIRGAVCLMSKTTQRAQRCLPLNFPEIRSTALTYLTAVQLVSVRRLRR